ncbi:efflux protein [Kwoniella heveanensis CBS 569]|nr:efflux protein [Kwoniella heveanensis CBS 569]
MRLELPSPPVSGYTTPTGHEDRPFFYPSATSTAVNTPSGLEDKPFLFPSNALAKYASRLSERSDNGDEEKGRESEKEKEEEDNGLESRRPSDVVGELESYPIPEKKALTKVRMAILGLVMMSTTFVASATSASTLLVIPSIAKDLGITELQAQWITSAYSLANGCGLLLAGRVADLYGKKWLYMLGMIAYLVLSIVSGVIRNYVAICVVRAFAGLAISISLPAAFGIIGVTFDAEPYRTMAFSALALGYPVGGGPGMIIAGLVAGINHRAWQYTFFILAGMALVPIVLGFFTIPNDKVKATPGGNRKIDWLGAFLITVALCLFTFALTQSGLTAKGWGEPYIGTCVGISVVLMIAFGFWEHIAETRTSIPPLVHLGIFSRHNWKVTSVLLLSFFGYTAISGWLYLVTIWYQNLKGDRPIMNAVHILPAPIVGMIACILVPMLAPRVKACYLLMLGGMCTATAQLLFAVAPVDLTYWACEFLSNIFTPFGADFTVGIGSVLISNLVSEDQQAVGGALFQTALQIASTVGVCISSLTETIITEQSGSLEKGLKDAFWMMAAFSWASMVIAFVTLRKTGLAKDIGKTQL